MKGRQTACATEREGALGCCGLLLMSRPVNAGDCEFSLGASVVSSARLGLVTHCAAVLQPEQRVFTQDTDRAPPNVCVQLI